MEDARLVRARQYLHTVRGSIDSNDIYLTYNDLIREIQQHTQFSTDLLLASLTPVPVDACYFEDCSCKNCNSGQKNKVP